MRLSYRFVHRMLWLVLAISVLALNGCPEPTPDNCSDCADCTAQGVACPVLVDEEGNPESEYCPDSEKDEVCNCVLRDEIECEVQPAPH